VLAALDTYYRTANANVHRAVHALAERATLQFEAARDTIAAFLHCPREQVIFTRGTTEGINLVARCFLQPQLQPGDEVLLTAMEHHSNIVPWQLAGAKTVAAPVNDAGELDIDAWRASITSRTRLIAVSHTSNALGTINPIHDLIAIAKAHGIPILIDAAQAIAHSPIDFASLDADFLVCSSHKAYGPTGFGVLLAKRHHLECMAPWHGGGDMIHSTWNELPYKFEAGTPDIAGAIGFASALQWINHLGLDAIAAHEHALLDYATERLCTIPGLKLIGTARHKSGILSFVMKQAHPQDIGSMLDMEGVAIRSGHHCTMPLMERMQVPATARASLAVYNHRDDIDQLVDALHKVVRVFS
jgi:cysteine desulfurase / selenocysteine lyase